MKKAEPLRSSKPVFAIKLFPQLSASLLIFDGFDRHHEYGHVAGGMLVCVNCGVKQVLWPAKEFHEPCFCIGEVAILLWFGQSNGLGWAESDQDLNGSYVVLANLRELRQAAVKGLQGFLGRAIAMVLAFQRGVRVLRLALPCGVFASSFQRLASLDLLESKDLIAHACLTFSVLL
ncbi:MAG: hypothetical protein ABSG17_09155 [Spirochaetia bacterium]